MGECVINNSQFVVDVFAPLCVGEWVRLVVLFLRSGPRRWARFPGPGSGSSLPLMWRTCLRCSRGTLMSPYIRVPLSLSLSRWNLWLSRAGTQRSVRGCGSEPHVRRGPSACAWTDRLRATERVHLHHSKLTTVARDRRDTREEITQVSVCLNKCMFSTSVWFMFVMFWTGRNTVNYFKMIHPCLTHLSLLFTVSSLKVFVFLLLEFPGFVSFKSRTC